MAAEILGSITCPMCGNEAATVHQQARGKKGARYIRCYDGRGGASMRCGTLQCIGPTGQRYIDANMRAEPAKASAPVAAPVERAPADAIASAGEDWSPGQPVRTPKPARAGRGFFERLLLEDEE
jgi:hypothetical protein